MEQFQPFQKVLVRDSIKNEWIPDFYRCNAINRHGEQIGFSVIGCGTYQYCIPYEGNEYLLGTTDSPTPKHEYKWGDKVEVRPNDIWVKALYFEKVDISDTKCTHRVFGINGVYGNLNHFVFHDKDIRPLAEGTDE